MLVIKTYGKNLFFKSNCIKKLKTLEITTNKHNEIYKNFFHLSGLFVLKEQ